MRRQFLPPTIYDSYLYIDGVCSDSGQQRKQESRNRAVLGVQVSQQLQKMAQGKKLLAWTPTEITNVKSAIAGHAKINDTLL